MQLPNPSASFSSHPAITGTLPNSVPGQSTQVADHGFGASLDMAVDRFMEDFGQSTIAFPQQNHGDINLDDPLHFPPFPY
jgi:hypothetical protein